MSYLPSSIAFLWTFDRSRSPECDWDTSRSVTVAVNKNIMITNSIGVTVTMGATTFWKTRGPVPAPRLLFSLDLFPPFPFLSLFPTPPLSSPLPPSPLLYFFLPPVSVNPFSTHSPPFPPSFFFIRLSSPPSPTLPSSPSLPFPTAASWEVSGEAVWAPSAGPGGVRPTNAFRQLYP